MATDFAEFWAALLKTHPVSGLIGMLLAAALAAKTAFFGGWLVVSIIKDQRRKL